LSNAGGINETKAWRLRVYRDYKRNFMCGRRASTPNLLFVSVPTASEETCYTPVIWDARQPDRTIFDFRLVWGTYRRV
jgi:hypothetical protein